MRISTIVELRSNTRLARRKDKINQTLLPSVDARDPQSWIVVLTVVGAVYGGANLEAVMELFLIGLALIAGTGIAFLLFVIEPRRKIYDYDPRDHEKLGPPIQRP